MSGASHQSVLLRLQQMEERFCELEARLAAPDATLDTAAYTRAVTEWKSLEEAVAAYRAYLSLEREYDAARELLDSGDREIAELAAEEVRILRERLDTQAEALLLYVIPKDPMDDRNVIVEIRAGAGGEEAALFAADLYRMYSMYAQRCGYKIDLLYVNETELGGFREIDFTLIGRGAYSRMKFESGVHRVQRVPKTESQGRIQTSTVTVAVLPEVEKVDVKINQADIRMESCKSSGAGGQHVNKTESAVRLTHIPTGIVVECQEERSQYKNRDKAMKLLEARLYRMQQEAQDAEIASERKNQVGTGDRSERIRTYNFPQGRITDHRIGLTLYSIDRFMAGEIEEMVRALATSQAQRLIQGT